MFFVYSSRLCSDLWYNLPMKDDDNTVTCDACGQPFPADHMADNGLASALCVPCDDQIAKDLDDIA